MAAVADGDFALSAAAESLRSRVSAEVVASIGVVLRAVRWLQLRRSFKTRGLWISILLKLLEGGRFESRLGGFDPSATPEGPLWERRGLTEST